MTDVDKLLAQARLKGEFVEAFAERLAVVSLEADITGSDLTYIVDELFIDLRHRRIIIDRGDATA